MGYFPSDIPFMSEDELIENGLKKPRDPSDGIDVYIYAIDLNVEKPELQKMPAKVRKSAYGYEVIYWVGPNDYKVWHSEFDISMIGVVYEPLDNIIELIVKMDKKESESITMIEDYCCKKAACIRKKLDMFHRGIGAAIQFRVTKVKKSEHLFGLRATAVMIDDFDPPEIPPVSREEFTLKTKWPELFEGEEDI